MDSFYKLIVTWEREMYNFIFSEYTYHVYFEEQALLF